MRSVAITDSYETLAKNSFSKQSYIKLSDFRDGLLCDRQLQFIIAFILIINLAFIGIHCLVQILRYFFLFDELISTLHLNSWPFLIDVDRSFAEWFNYLQATMCAAMLLGVFRVTRQPVYAAWALIFFFVAMDDSLNIHERGASYIVTTFGFPALPGLGSQASASLLVWPLIGSVVVGILWWGIARSRRGARAAGRVLALAFVALFFSRLASICFMSCFPRPA